MTTLVIALLVLVLLLTLNTLHLMRKESAHQTTLTALNAKHQEQVDELEKRNQTQSGMIKSLKEDIKEAKDGRITEHDEELATMQAAINTLKSDVSRLEPGHIYTKMLRLGDTETIKTTIMIDDQTMAMDHKGNVTATMHNNTISLGSLAGGNDASYLRMKALTQRNVLHQLDREANLVAQS